MKLKTDSKENYWIWPFGEKKNSKIHNPLAGLTKGKKEKKEKGEKEKTQIAYMKNETGDSTINCRYQNVNKEILQTILQTM